METAGLLHIPAVVGNGEDTNEPQPSLPTTTSGLLSDEEQQPNVHALTLDEKLQLITGKSLWLLADLPVHNVPSIMLCDGPHGVRKPKSETSLQDSHKATCFPTACALSCSWDPGLVRNVGVSLARECQHYRISCLLGCGQNLVRHPAGGRRFEYFSADPYLTGTLAAAYVQGVQSSGQVSACIKHFCVNNQETNRFVVNAVVDERTCRELYYRGFEMVVKSQSPPGAIMCAYNKVNGSYCSENMCLNQQLLREEWNYQGLLMSDWGAVNDRVAGLQSGLDLEMPGSHTAHTMYIRDALTNGSLDISDLDTCAGRVLEFIQQYRYIAGDDDDDEALDWTAQHKLAKETAMQCAVLLKNDHNFLPLARNTNVAVIGDFARDHPRYQGMGSSQVFSDTVVTTFTELQRRTKTIHFAPGYHADLDDAEHVEQVMVDEAVTVAQKGDVVLLCIGLPEIMESEGFDRDHLQLPAQHNALVNAVCDVSDKVVVVLSNGGAMELPWADKPQVKAIFEGYLLGETGGAAIVDLIFGVASPCGKLSETFPYQQSDALADKYFPGNRDIVQHREGLDVDYRYFDSVDVPVRFPFGHGLSYTTWNYSNLHANIVADDETEKRVDVEVELTNSGTYEAREVVQCYVRDLEASVYRPMQELRAYQKVLVRPGETATVKMTLSTDAFAFYDTGRSEWVIEPGQFEIRIGSSSRDIRLKHVLNFKNGKEASNEAQISYPPFPSGDESHDVDTPTFAKRFGDRQDTVMTEVLAAENVPNDNDFNRNTMLKEIANRRFIGWIFLNVVYRSAVAGVQDGPAKRRQQHMVRRNVEGLPLRVIVLFSRGHLSFEILDACIASMNFQVWLAVKIFSYGMYVMLFRRRR